MTKLISASLILIFLTGCDDIINSLLNPGDELCTTNKIPTTPEGATDAEVEREVVEMCRDQERDR